MNTMQRIVTLLALAAVAASCYWAPWLGTKSKKTFDLATINLRLAREAPLQFHYPPGNSNYFRSLDFITKEREKESAPEEAPIVNEYRPIWWNGHLWRGSITEFTQTQCQLKVAQLVSEWAAIAILWGGLMLVCRGSSAPKTEPPTPVGPPDLPS